MKLRLPARKLSDAGHTFLAVDTRTAHVASFDDADVGKTAHRMLRWVSATGEKGPWSETAMIGA